MVDKLSVLIGLCAALFRVDHLPTDFFKGFAIDFGCVGEVVFAKHRTFIFFVYVVAFSHHFG